jgi:cytochrome c biogenesis protein CcmG, thiol:disulfide interchange protein DsbE
VAGPNAEPPGPRRLIGPFTARQLGAVAAVVVVAALVLVVVTRPIAAGPAGATPIPVQTAQIVGQVTEGLHVGDLAPELAVKGADGSPAPLLDLSGNPVTLAALRGKVVWLNFWASWCPPCQGETPVLRDMDEQYRARGLAIVGVAVQETTPDDVKAYAAKYALAYTIAFDATADVFNRYKVYALPTQVFVGPDGRVLEVVDGPLTDDTAGSRIQGWLPQPSAAPASAAP